MQGHPRGDTDKLHDPESTITTEADLETDLEHGLDDVEVARRLKAHGPNALEEVRVSPLRRFLSYFWGPIPWMIEAAAVLSASVQHWEDFTIIMVMLLLNAGVGFWEEFKADNAIAALKQTMALSARVLRNGKWQDTPAAGLVPGDVVFLRLGNIVPADVQLVSGDYLSIDQSALTGESLPVDKKTGDTAYSSSVIKMGEMRAVVTATGAATYFGRTASLVERAGTRSHFQRAVLRIGNFLMLTTLALIALILIVALFRQDPLVDTLLFALILTVAAIPVALPAVLSVTMAVGASRLAAMKAIVSRLVSIEEIAGLDILCADKTGTLTRNQLALGEPALLSASTPDEVILAAALSSDRQSPDAIDRAILEGLQHPEVLARYQVARFHGFDPVRKRAEAELKGPDGLFQAAKGAPQVILELTGADEQTRQRVDAYTDELAASGYRTLGVAATDTRGEWHYLGLLPLYDPPREDSRETIEQAQAMGVGIRMVTGDHVAIAKQISGELGLRQNIVLANEAFGADSDRYLGPDIECVDGFAQVFPEHKYQIVRHLQSADHIVGMTGDGVNDAPALKQADVGIAVSGATDAARAAADLILTGDGLSVITRAIEESRKIFERMTSYAIFRISETIRVLLVMTLSIMIFNFYPVTPVMIVMLAILNDFPIMMIAFDNAPVAKQPVRWDMHRVLTLSIALGLMGVISTFTLFWIVQDVMQLPRETIQTLIFLKLLVAGHLTIYLTRNTGKIWDRPWPNWKLFVTTELTQVLGTLAAVFGWFVSPIDWRYALAIWCYALIWFLINSVVKIHVYRLTRLLASHQTRHLERVET
jgi:H+-transporting ATPase